MRVADSRREGLDRRIRDYHGVALDEVLELIDYLRDPGDSVIAGGSLTLGLGNQRSDLDVVVVVRGGEGSGRMPLEHWQGSLRVDAWKLRQATIDDIFERAERRLNDEAAFDGAFGNVHEQADLKLLHRVAFGVHLDGAQLRPTRTRDYREIARDLIAREYAERMRTAALLGQLAVRSGQSIAAATNARLAVEGALHAVLAARGVGFTGDKWLEQRLAEVDPELHKSYRRSAILPRQRDGAWKRFVGRAIETCEESTGLDLSLASLGRFASFGNTDLQAMRIGKEDLLLSVSQGGLWRLEPDEAKAWRGLEEKGSRVLDVLAEDESRLCLALHQQGLLKLSWERGLPLHELSLGEVVGA